MTCLNSGLGFTNQVNAGVRQRNVRASRLNACDLVQFISATQLGLGQTTTKGDLIGHDGTASVRVPVGTDGQVLVADSSTTSGVDWGFTVPSSGAKAHLAANTIILSGTTTVMAPWSIIFTGDYNSGDFNLSTGVFTTPRTGIYEISASVPIFNADPTSTTSLSVLFINVEISTDGGTNFIAVDVPIAILLGATTILDSFFDSVTYSPSSTYSLNAGDQLRLSVTPTFAGPGPILIVGGSTIGATISFKELVA